jgi:hypothetical protein
LLSTRRFVIESSAMASRATMGLWCGCWGAMIPLFFVSFFAQRSSQIFNGLEFKLQ